ncbi:tRNA (adenosine(37)-N6)-dimethylallyltransferase MiaA [Marispirochaeta aestuarii]|uniref:tRNA (adenosine(37)-N6)-dimethylallyltransferase MiaA n=1 Tax=Marispirochaeta aestuarii TaxID=1963862 RepID=UPI0029C940F9|nr:tRNA (adenosine(37)-N6)-dimethylallyltransferase MiaA [Marispirochaeta aestuarii]
MKSKSALRHHEPPVLPVVLLFGPTGVGKTDLIRNLPVEYFEVISADSMQVYRGMDIGTAKPDRAFREHIPHHLIDIRNPGEQFHLGDFIRLADEAVLDILKRGRLPVISGGTAYYFKHFLYGLPEAPSSDPHIRAGLAARVQREGLEPLREMLHRVDPVSAERIDANDAYRIQRALEVYMSSGRPLSSFRLPEKLREGLDPLIIGLTRPREELYRRIDRRVEEMFAAGLPMEVASLKQAGYGPGDPGMKAIGYREFFEGEGEPLPRIQTASRRYAKRQLTFFRTLPGTIWMNPEEGEEIISRIYSFFNSRKESISRISSVSSE